MKKRLLSASLILLLIAALYAPAQAGTLTLPSMITRIEEEAFYGDTGLDEVVLPEGVVQIGSRAFAHSSLRRITIPSSVTMIAVNAFEGVADLMCVVNENSYAAMYCAARGISYGYPVSFVTLDRTEVSLSAGSSVRLAAQVYPENAFDTTVSWSVSDPSVALVSDSGLVTGVGAGTCVVTASASGDPAVYVQCDVAVGGGSLTVTPEQLDTMPPEGGTIAFRVNAGAGTWTCRAASDETWITLSAESGEGRGFVTLEAEENTSTRIRTADIVFASGSASQIVTVVQAPYILHISPESLETVDADGGNVTVSVSSGFGGWTASSSAQWITLSQYSGTGNGTGVTITAGANASLARSGEVTFISGNLSKTITVVQDGESFFSVTPDAFDPVDASGGALNVAVSSGSMLWTASSGVSWIDLSQFSGSGNGTWVTLTVAENTSLYPRTANVVFHCGGRSKTIAVTQNGISGFSVSPDSFDVVSADGGALTAVVSSGSQVWTAHSEVSWVTLSRYSGVGSGTSVVLTVAANTSSDPRSANVVFWCAGRSVTVRIAQAAPSGSTGRVTALSVSLQGHKYIGTPYSTYDCQAFVEKCLSDAGMNVDLAGSNAWYRQMTWRGTPEECMARFGFIPRGAFLFIVAHDGNEPPRYYPDGLGNANHIGLYTGTGLGAIHSSYTRQGVYESYFACETINGGWNMVGLWKELDYGSDEINLFLATQ